MAARGGPSARAIGPLERLCREHSGERPLRTRVDAPGPSAERDIAVAIEPASPAERRALFTRSHGLTPRETELVGHLAQGADTRAVARALFVPENTVPDQLKSIFAKTGSRNRRTLVACVAGR